MVALPPPLLASCRAAAAAHARAAAAAAAEQPAVEGLRAGRRAAAAARARPPAPPLPGALRDASGLFAVPLPPALRAAVDDFALSALPAHVGVGDGDLAELLRDPDPAQQTELLERASRAAEEAGSQSWPSTCCLCGARPMLREAPCWPVSLIAAADFCARVRRYWWPRGQALLLDDAQARAYHATPAVAQPALPVITLPLGAGDADALVHAYPQFVIRGPAVGSSSGGGSGGGGGGGTVIDGGSVVDGGSGGSGGGMRSESSSGGSVSPPASPPPPPPPCAGVRCDGTCAAVREQAALRARPIAQLPVCARCIEAWRSPTGSAPSVEPLAAPALTVAGGWPFPDMREVHFYQLLSPYESIVVAPVRAFFRVAARGDQGGRRRARRAAVLCHRLCAARRAARHCRGARRRGGGGDGGSGGGRGGGGGGRRRRRCRRRRRRRRPPHRVRRL